MATLVVGWDVCSILADDMSTGGQGDQLTCDLHFLPPLRPQSQAVCLELHVTCMSDSWVIRKNVHQVTK